MGLDEYAVLLIDMQPGCVRRFYQRHLRNLIGAQMNVLKYCRQNRIPVVATENIPDAGETMPALLRIAAPCMRYPAIRKKFQDGFEETGLEEILKNRLRASHLILMGVVDSSCVEATARGAIKRKFAILTAQDLIGDCIEGLSNHNWFIFNGSYFSSHQKMISELEDRRIFYETQELMTRDRA